MKTLLYAAILAASLWILTEFLEMASPEGFTPLSMWLTTLWHPILALGFWGLHKSQSPKRNRLSLIGVLLLILSFIAFAPVSLMILNSTVVNSFPEFIQQNPIYQVFGLMSLIGYILFAISMIRTRYYAGWMGFVILLTVLLSVVQNFAQLAEIWQHVAFIITSLVIISMSVFALRQQTKG